MDSFSPPTLHETAVPRQRLFRLLDESRAPVLYLCAPAGYGKTIGTALWIKQFRNKTAWVTLDEYSGIPLRFCRKLLGALCTAQGANRKLRAQLDKLEETAYPADVLLASLPLLLHNGKPYILVLDDWHRIRNERLTALLPDFLLGLPENWKVIILSRELPGGKLADLALKEHMAVYTGGVLAFDADEVKALYRKSNRNISDAGAKAVVEETGGWAIAVNARRLGETAFDKNLENIFESYLDSQVWGGLDREEQRLLLYTSVAELLTEPFCRRVSGQEDCARRLENLYRKNTFLSREQNGAYRLHHLFKDYVCGKFARLPVEEQKDTWNAAGEWFLEVEDYFEAASYFIKAQNPPRISQCLLATSNYAITNDIEWRLEFAKRQLRSLDKSFIAGNRHLTGQCAWMHYLDGDAQSYEKHMNRIYLWMRRETEPGLLLNAAMMSSLDYCTPIATFMKILKQKLAGMQLPETADVSILCSSVTLNMPYAHRSMRDYSECADHLEPFLALSRQSIGVLLGAQYEVLEHAVRAGIQYERGELDSACEEAQRAVETPSDSPEILFAAHMIYIKILHAMGDEKEIRREEIWIEEMLDTRGALYLEPNYLSYLCDKHIEDGRQNAAREWLAHHSTDREGQLSFYGIHQHMTTGRAYLATGQCEAAILLLKKVVQLGTLYRRPLDFIQANILLATAYWQNHEQKNAIAAMERAVLKAQGYGFTRIFLDESRTAAPLVLRSLLQSVRARPFCRVKTAFLHTLLGGIESAGAAPAAANLQEAVALSKRQLEVLALMAEGLTYPQIARRLSLEQATVKTHAKAIFQKLNVNSREDAVYRAKQLDVPLRQSKWEE